MARKYTFPAKRTYYPSLVRRYVAALIDGIVAFGLAAISIKFINYLEVDSSWIKYIVFYGILFSYEPIFTSKLVSLGQYLMRFRVRLLSEVPTWAGHDIKGRIGLTRAYWRYFVKWFFGFISLLTVPGSKGFRAIHDKAAGSIVMDISYLREHCRIDRP